VSPQRRNDDGVPMFTARLAQAPVEEKWAGANEAKDEKLRLKGIRRRAGARGYELRHSDHGYALVGAERKPVNGRNDLSLKEVETLLAAAPER
jgi:hypothetical protein